MSKLGPKKNKIKSFMVSKKKSCTLFVPASNVKCFSAWIIFPTKSQSRRRCSWRKEPLVSKHDIIIFSTWWCKKLLYGYLRNSNSVSKWEIKWLAQDNKIVELTRRTSVQFFVMLQIRSTSSQQLHYQQLITLIKTLQSEKTNVQLILWQCYNTLLKIFKIMNHE